MKYAADVTGRPTDLLAMRFIGTSTFQRANPRLALSVHVLPDGRLNFDWSRSSNRRFRRRYRCHSVLNQSSAIAQSSTFLHRGWDLFYVEVLIQYARFNMT